MTRLCASRDVSRSYFPVEMPVTMNMFAMVRISLLFALSLGLTACESSKARQEAIQFAFSWEQTIKAFGLSYMSDLPDV